MRAESVVPAKQSKQRHPLLKWESDIRRNKAIAEHLKPLQDFFWLVRIRLNQLKAAGVESGVDRAQKAGLDQDPALSLRLTYKGIQKQWVCCLQYLQDCFEQMQLMREEQQQGNTYRWQKVTNDYVLIDDLLIWVHGIIQQEVGIYKRASWMSFLLLMRSSMHATKEAFSFMAFFDLQAQLTRSKVCEVWPAWKVNQPALRFAIRVQLNDSHFLKEGIECTAEPFEFQLHDALNTVNIVQLIWFLLDKDRKVKWVNDTHADKFYFNLLMVVSYALPLRVGFNGDGMVQLPPLLAQQNVIKAELAIRLQLVDILNIGAKNNKVYKNVAKGLQQSIQELIEDLTLFIAISALTDFQRSILSAFTDYVESIILNHQEAARLKKQANARDAVVEPASLAERLDELSDNIVCQAAQQLQQLWGKQGMLGQEPKPKPKLSVSEKEVLKIPAAEQGDISGEELVSPR